MHAGGFVAGLLAVLALATVCVGAIRAGGGGRSDRPDTGGAPRPDVVAPGTGSGFDRQMAALAEGVDSGDLGRSFRRQAKQGIYGMFSDAGDREVAKVVAAIRADIEAGELRTVDAVNEELSKRAWDLDQRGYEEVYDTVVRDHVGAALEPAMRRAGMDPAELVLD